MAVYRKTDDLPPDFDVVLDSAGRQNLFLSEGWFDNFIRTVVDDETNLRIFAAAVEGSKVVLPMRDSKRIGPLALRELLSLSNYYSSRFEPLVQGTGPAMTLAMNSIVSDITSSVPRWDVVDVSPHGSDNPAVGCLAECLRDSNWAVQSYKCFDNLYLVNEFENFDAYLKTRSSRIRKTAANRTRAFDKDAANSFRIVTSPDDVDDALKAFGQLHEKRWRRSEPYPRFLSGLATMCATRGWLRMGIAEVAGNPAAAQLWIVKDNVAYIYKVAYDNQYTRMSVGNVVLFKMFQHVLDNEGVREIDFLTGDDSYKRDWMSHSREMMGLRAFNKRTLRGVASACRHIGGRAIKSRIKR